MTDNRKDSRLYSLVAVKKEKAAGPVEDKIDRDMADNEDPSLLLVAVLWSDVRRRQVDHELIFRRYDVEQ